MINKSPLTTKVTFIPQPEVPKAGDFGWSEDHEYEETFRDLKVVDVESSLSEKMSPRKISDHFGVLFNMPFVFENLNSKKGNLREVPIVENNNPLIDSNVNPICIFISNKYNPDDYALFQIGPFIGSESNQRLTLVAASSDSNDRLLLPVTGLRSRFSGRRMHPSVVSESRTNQKHICSSFKLHSLSSFEIAPGIEMSELKEYSPENPLQNLDFYIGSTSLQKKECFKKGTWVSFISQIFKDVPLIRVSFRDSMAANGSVVSRIWIDKKYTENDNWTVSLIYPQRIAGKLKK